MRAYAGAYHSLGSHRRARIHLCTWSAGNAGGDRARVQQGGRGWHLTRHSNEVVTRMPRYLINSD